MRFENRVSAELIAPPFLQVVQHAAVDAARTGVLVGYAMIDLKAALVDASAHDVETSELAFEAATRIAFDKAARAARPVLMEPIMRVQVVTPEAYFGVVSGDLSRRRAEVTDSTQRGDQRVLEITAPLKDTFGYATDLRSLTQGRASWTMEPSHYAVLPRRWLTQSLA